MKEKIKNMSIEEAREKVKFVCEGGDKELLLRAKRKLEALIEEYGILVDKKQLEELNDTIKS